MAGYLVALDGVSAQALKLTAMAVIQGQIEDMSAKVCPQPPELSRAVRKRMREDRQRELAAAPKLAELPPPRAIPSANMAKLKAEFQEWKNGAPAGPLMKAAVEKYFGGHQPRTYDGRPFLCDAPSFAAAQQMAKTGVAPPGSLYVPRFGAFYSPKPEGPDHDRADQRPQPDGDDPVVDP